MGFRHERGEEDDGARDDEAPGKARRGTPADAGQHRRDAEKGERLEGDADPEEERGPWRGVGTTTLEGQRRPHDERQRTQSSG